MTICDGTKGCNEMPERYMVRLAPAGEQKLHFAAVDLCKGCKEIFEQKIKNIITLMKREAKP